MSARNTESTSETPPRDPCTTSMVADTASQNTTIAPRNLVPVLPANAAGSSGGEHAESAVENAGNARPPQLSSHVAAQTRQPAEHAAPSRPLEPLHWQIDPQKVIMEVF